MYDARVGIISEGPMDQMLIKQIVSAEFPNRSFIFTAISPTEDEIDVGAKAEGFGWGGVYKVCKSLKDRLEILHAAGMDFDFFVIHIDGDVMKVTYESARIKKEAEDGFLPCYEASASIADNCRLLSKVVESWIGKKEKNNIICIPYINSDIWIAYALYKEHRMFITQTLQKDLLEKFLFERTKKEGRLIKMHQGHIKKDRRVYSVAIDAITPSLMQKMKSQFSQLNLFCEDIGVLFDQVPDLMKPVIEDQNNCK